jgi:hypothetical protein
MAGDNFMPHFAVGIAFVLSDGASFIAEEMHNAVDRIRYSEKLLSR